MEKTATLNLRVNPSLKTDAEAILSQLGIPMSVAVDMFLNQVVLVGGIPFSIILPTPPADIDLARMTDVELHEKLQRGYDECKAGKTKKASTVFAEFRKNH